MSFGSGKYWKYGKSLCLDFLISNKQIQTEYYLAWLAYPLKEVIVGQRNQFDVITVELYVK